MADEPAYTLFEREPSAIPVLLAVPHAGRCYPPSLLGRMRNPAVAATRLEDRLVDRLAERIAAATGASLLVAHAPRAMIDLNRSCDDIDHEMFVRGTVERSDSYAPGLRARSGLGLIPRRLPGFGELWKHRHEARELAERISQIHQPYHDCLGHALGRLRQRWGATLLIDLHSMPPLPRQGGQPQPEFVLGDRFGAAASGQVVAAAFAWFAGARRLAAHNRPYAGGYVLERHARPAGGISALQLEIDRSRYLDSRLSEPGEGFADMVEVLTGLVRRLAAEVAEAGRLASVAGTVGMGWPQAAE